MFVAIFITSAATHDMPGCVETSTKAKIANVSGAIAVFSLIRDNLSNYPHLLIWTKAKNVSLWMEIWNGLQGELRRLSSLFFTGVMRQTRARDVSVSPCPSQKIDDHHAVVIGQAR